MRIPWSAMTPRDVFDSLACAPSKVAGQWQPPEVYGGQERYPACRRTPQGQTIVWDRDGIVSVHNWCVPADAPIKDIQFKTRDEADAWLRNMGWLLVDPDEPAAAVSANA